MQYIIALFIILVVLSAAVVLIKYVLFHPVVNSAIVGLFYLLILISVISELYIRIKGTGDFSYITGGTILIMIMLLIMFDCIWDIVHAEQYYSDFELNIDKEFAVKSLSSILTFGLSRLIFLFIVRPIRSFRTLLYIKKKIRDGYPLSSGGGYYDTKWKRKLEKKGMIISNIKTVTNEAEIRRKKLEALYPKKTLEKVVDMVAGDKIVKEKRKDAEKRLQTESLAMCYAYLGTAAFEQYPKLIMEVMSEKGCHSVSDIKKFAELKSLHLTFPFYGKNGKNTEWSEYFIIQALKPLVAEGIFEDDDLNDNDVFDNHAYRYTKSKVTMKCIDADNDPRFALDD